MKRKQQRASGYTKEQLQRTKYASVESKLNALTSMIELAVEAQKSCKKRGAKVHPLF